jgi:hypothetical protein
LISSRDSNVRLDSGTEMILRVNVMWTTRVENRPLHRKNRAVRPPFRLKAVFCF